MIKKEHLTTEQNNFSPIAYLLDHTPGKVYNFKEYEVIGKNIKELEDIINKFKKLQKVVYNYFTTNEKNCLLKLYFINKSTNKVSICINYADTFDLELFYQTIIKDIEYKEDSSFGKFNLITITKNGPETFTKSLKSKIDIDLKNSYNLTFPLDKIQTILESNNSGLLLFTGNPGTGKSYLIKYFSQILPNKKFFFLSNNNLHILSDPSFITYCLTDLENSVLVLEDCELALKSRDHSKSFDISTILNLTDGILGDLINLKIIATLNTIDKLDSALLRKGRLLCKVDFKPLKVEQANNLSTKLGKCCKIDKETELCNIYNLEDNNGLAVTATKVGFTIN